MRTTPRPAATSVVRGRTLNFGNPFSTTTVNPDVLHGWGIRPYDWQFSVGVQHEVCTRVAVDVKLQPPLVGQPLLH